LNYKITNRATGSLFEARSQEPLLSASRRAQLHFNHSCLNGHCGRCMAELVEGEVSYPALPPVALEAEQSLPDEAPTGNRKILLCQAVAESDLTIIAREPAALKNIQTKIAQARVHSIEFPVDDVACIKLDLEEHKPLTYLAGQYLEVILTSGKRRAFSIANAPDDSGLLELHIRHVQGGGFTDHVFDQMTVGDPIDLEVPLGTFFLRSRSERPILCVTGGTGFAPIKAIVEELILRHEHSKESRPVHLYWGAQSAGELYQHDRVTQWVDELPWFSYTPVISNINGHSGLRLGWVHEAVVDDHPDLAGFDVYMSGPPALVDAGRASFRRHGLPRRHLYYDSFEFAPDILALMAQQDDAASGLTAAE